MKLCCVKQQHSVTRTHTFTFPSAHVTQHGVTQGATSTIAFCCRRNLLWHGGARNVEKEAVGLPFVYSLCLFVAEQELLQGPRRQNGNYSHPFLANSLHRLTDLGSVSSCEPPLAKRGITLILDQCSSCWFFFSQSLALLGYHFLFFFYSQPLRGLIGYLCC